MPPGGASSSSPWTAAALVWLLQTTSLDERHGGTITSSTTHRHEFYTLPTDANESPNTFQCSTCRACLRFPSSVAQQPLLPVCPAGGADTSSSFPMGVHHFHSKKESTATRLSVECCECHGQITATAHAPTVPSHLLDSLRQSTKRDGSNIGEASLLYAQCLDLLITYGDNAWLAGDARSINAANPAVLGTFGAYPEGPLLMQVLGFTLVEGMYIRENGVDSLETYSNALLELKLELWLQLRNNEAWKSQFRWKSKIVTFLDGLNPLLKRVGCNYIPDSHFPQWEQTLHFKTLGCVEYVLKVYQNIFIGDGMDSNMPDAAICWAFRRTYQEGNVDRELLTSSLMEVGTLRNSVEIIAAATAVSSGEAYGSNAGLVRAQTVSSLDAVPSYSTDTAIVGGESTSVSVEEAYILLGADPSTEDDTIRVAFEIASADRPKDLAQLQQSLKKIAEARKSDGLMAYCIEIGVIDAVQRQGSFFEMDDQWVLSETGTTSSSNTPHDPTMSVGLNNIGNTCYLNSLLQFYFTIRPIRESILAYSPTICPPTSPSADPDLDPKQVTNARRFVELYRKLFVEMVWSQKRSISPAKELAKLALGGRLEAGQEQDISECMGNMMTLLSTCWRSHNGSENVDLLTELFDGKQVQTLIYTDKSTGKPVKNRKKEAFLQILIETSRSVTGSTPSSPRILLECLQQYFADTVVDFEGSQAFRSLALSKAPPILTIQIQRAQYDRDKKAAFKSNEYIQFPDTLDLAQFMDKQSQSPTTSTPRPQKYSYRLHAVFIHKGSDAQFGHYFAFIKNYEAEKWLKFNDTEVDMVADEQKEVFGDLQWMNANAYCLVYIRAEDLEELTPGAVCRSEEWRQLYLSQFAELRQMVVDLVVKST